MSASNVTPIRAEAPSLRQRREATPARLARAERLLRVCAAAYSEDDGELSQDLTSTDIVDFLETAMELLGDAWTDIPPDEVFNAVDVLICAKSAIVSGVCAGGAPHGFGLTTGPPQGAIRVAVNCLKSAAEALQASAARQGKKTGRRAPGSA